MQIVIDISEELYESAIKDTYTGIDERDAIDAIKHGKALSKDWILVSERVPEANEHDGNGNLKAYLVQDNSQRMYVARWNSEEWIIWGHGFKVENVIAWMPLPEAYNGDLK